MSVKSPRRPPRPRSSELLHAELTGQIVDSAIAVHSALGPGLLESAYEECLCYELHDRGLAFRRQVALPVRYKAMRLDCGYRMDLVVEKSVLLELKAVERLLPLHEAQLLTYLKLSDLQVGFLLNFNAVPMRNGIRRYAN